MVYAFLMPKLKFNEKQLLFWNLLIKLCHIPLVVIILLAALITLLIGGEAMRDAVPSVVLIAFSSCYMLQLSSAIYSAAGQIVNEEYGKTIIPLG